jgi:hypothetical protein
VLRLHAAAAPGGHQALSSAEPRSFQRFGGNERHFDCHDSLGDDLFGKGERLRSVEIAKDFDDPITQDPFEDLEPIEGCGQDSTTPSAVIRPTPSPSYATAVRRVSIVWPGASTSAVPFSIAAAVPEGGQLVKGSRATL